MFLQFPPPTTFNERVQPLRIPLLCLESYSGWNFNGPTSLRCNSTIPATHSQKTMPQFSERAFARNMRFANNVRMSVVIAQRIGYNVNRVFDLPDSLVAGHNIVNPPHTLSPQATDIILRLSLRVSWVMPTYTGAVNRYLFISVKERFRHQFRRSNLAINVDWQHATIQQLVVRHGV